MGNERRERFYKFYDPNRKTRYTAELKKIDPRLSFVWNKYLRKWTIFQNNKRIGHYNSEREGINAIKYIHHFHKNTHNSNKEIERIEREQELKVERERNKLIEEAATEAGERAVVGVYGVTPTFSIGSSK